MKALAVFHDHGNHIFARFLEPGFRHVFIVLQSGNYWIRVDGMSGVPVVEVVAAADYDLAVFYRDEGYAVVEVQVETAAPRGPLANTNCVGLSKVFLGIRRSFIVTPHGLYRHLRNAT